jgi:replication factor A2
VTIKQVINADQAHNDADFTIDGHDVNQVLLVGNVHSMSSSATNVSYSIGDGTGYIDVRQWLETAEDDTGKMDGIECVRFIPPLRTLVSAPDTSECGD